MDSGRHGRLGQSAPPQRRPSASRWWTAPGAIACCNGSRGLSHPHGLQRDRHEALAAGGWPDSECGKLLGSTSSRCPPGMYFGYDMAGVGGWFDLHPLRGYSEVLEETDEWEVKRNGSGAALKYWKHHMGTPEHMDFLMTSREVWERELSAAPVGVRCRAARRASRKPEGTWPEAWARAVGRTWATCLSGRGCGRAWAMWPCTLA